MGKKVTTEDFIKKAKEVHGDRYNYDKVIYLNAKSKIIITCSIHGDFEQSPNSHLRGSGCPKCGIKSRIKSTLGTIVDIKNKFIKKSNNIHNNKYDYSKVNYVNNRTKVCIICLDHGEFWQTPDSHTQGSGCPKCKTKNLQNLYKDSLSQFIEKANLIHNNLYVYPEQEYINQRTKIKIICPKHGEFWQFPTNHLKGHGCKCCLVSTGERYISDLLNSYNIFYIAQHKLELHKICKNTKIVYVDFFVKYNNKQYVIEYDGIQHFEYIPHFHKKDINNFYKQQNRDNVLKEYCILNNIEFISIPYSFTNNEIINELKLKFNLSKD